MEEGDSSKPVKSKAELKRERRELQVNIVYCYLNLWRVVVILFLITSFKLCSGETVQIIKKNI